MKERSHSTPEVCSGATENGQTVSIYVEPRAYPLLTQFFSIPGDIVDDVTGEVVTSDLCRILASVSGGDSRLMMAVAENESANNYVRDAAL